MNTKLIAVLALAASFGLSPILLAADKTKDDPAKTAKPAKVTPNASSDRASFWHGNNWRVSATPPRKSISAVRVVPYQQPSAASVTTRPEGEYTYTLRNPDTHYDYFAAHYGYESPSPVRTTTSRPAEVLGYVPPADNTHNPFIYHRASK